MTKNEIICKIKKCLQLSSSSNEHEAALAVERAQAMMEKYGISTTDIELSEISGCTVRSHNSRRLPKHIAILADLVGRAFGCDYIFLPKWGHDFRIVQDIEFIGFDTRPEIAAYAFSVLLRQKERGRTRFLKTLSKRIKRSNKIRLADNWSEGWATAVWKKVREMSVSEEDKSRLQEWMDRRHGSNIEKTKAHSSGKFGVRGLRAFLDGVQSGQKVDLYRGVVKDHQPLLQ